jgi:hypothetical protein
MCLVFVGDSLRGLSDPVRALATKGGGVTERGQGKPPAGQRLRGLQARRNPLGARCSSPNWVQVSNAATVCTALESVESLVG